MVELRPKFTPFPEPKHSLGCQRYSSSSCSCGAAAQIAIAVLKTRVQALEAVLDAAKRYKELPMSDDDNRRMWLAIQYADHT